MQWIAPFPGKRRDTTRIKDTLGWISAFVESQDLERFVMSARSMFGVFVLSGLAPIAAHAAACGNYDLSAAQQQFIDTQTVEIPVGEVPQIQRCDVNEDNVVDIHDIRAISRNRNQPAAHPDDPMDWDKNHVINVRDARGCQRLCALPRCRTPAAPQPQEEAQLGGESEPAECSQTGDFDGDGVANDFVGMYEHTGEDTRGGEWTLEVVIMTADESGNVEAVTFPYTGKNLKSTGELNQHVSMQPAGPVNLNPGSLTINEPAVVSYIDGEPKVIYYFVNGEIARAFYGIDD